MALPPLVKARWRMRSWVHDPLSACVIINLLLFPRGIFFKMKS